MAETRMVRLTDASNPQGVGDTLTLSASDAARVVSEGTAVYADGPASEGPIETEAAK